MVSAQQKQEAVNAFIAHHVADSQVWHLPFMEVHFSPWMSLHAMMLVIASAFLIWLFVGKYKKSPAAPSGLTNFLETFVVFIRDDVCIPNLGPADGRRMAPLFLSFFFFILSLNLLGLVPNMAGATADISVTFALAMITLSFMVLGGIYLHGPIGFVKVFMPHGVPWPILLILVPMEMMGMVIKSGALTIRLFANMFAGHIVILSLLGLLVVYGGPALPALVLAVGIFLMKIGIAVLQAYIFTMLSALFMGQIYHPAH